MGRERSLWLFSSHDQERQYPASKVAFMHFHNPLSDIAVSYEVMQGIEHRAKGKGYEARNAGKTRKARKVIASLG